MSTRTLVPLVDQTSTDPRANLDRLATELEHLPADYQHFDMRDFMRDQNPANARDYALNNGGVQSCGTAACAVGHGPAAHMFFKEHEIFDSCTPNWAAYSRRVFDCSPGDDDFEWMFGGDWVYADNTVHGAAARIRYFLEHGTPDLTDSYDERIDFSDFTHLYKDYVK